MIWMDLTPEIVRQRVIVLAPLALGESYRRGWTPEEFVGALGCDECSAVVDLGATIDLSGWTTSGDPRNGFVDRCPDCSARPVPPQSEQTAESSH